MKFGENNPIFTIEQFHNNYNNYFRFILLMIYFQMIAWIRTDSNRMSIVRYCISHGKLVMGGPFPPNPPPPHTIIPVNYWSQAEMIDGTNIVFVNSP